MMYRFDNFEDDSWIDIFVAEGLIQLEEYLAKWAAFQSFLTDV